MDHSTTHDREDQDAERKRDQHGHEPATDEGTSTDDGAPAAPFEPDSDDETALGDTDEHSDA